MMANMIAVLGMTQEEGQALLLTEGDRLARQLVQQLTPRQNELERAYVVGRSVAVNLVQAFVPTAETVTRRQGRPLTLYLSTDERGLAEIVAVNADGELHEHLPVDDLIEGALYLRGRLIPQARTELEAAMYAPNERVMTLALIRLFRLRCVLDATGTALKRYGAPRRLTPP